MKQAGQGRAWRIAELRCKSLVLAAALACPALGNAQSMTLNGGLTIAAGTRIALSGPLQWSLVPGTQLLNNGRIELGTDAIVLEPDDSPITGSGTEHAWIDQVGALNTVNAGNLGLTLGSTVPLPATEVVRGHDALVNDTMDVSVLRWFRLSPDPGPEVELDLIFRTVPSELNGLDPTTLALYVGNETLGTWSFLPSVPNAPDLSVSATWAGPWGIISAFTQGIITGTGSSPVEARYTVRPSIAEDILHVSSISGEMIERIEIFDAAGRMVLVPMLTRTRDSLSIPIGQLVSGPYLLRINGAVTVRFIRS